MIASKTSGVTFWPVAMGLNRFASISRRPMISVQLRAHGWIAGVARQLVKNQLPDAFATLQAVLFASSSRWSVSRRVILKRLCVIRNDSSFLALSVIESSFSSAMRVPSHFNSRTDSAKSHESVSL